MNRGDIQTNDLHKIKAAEASRMKYYRFTNSAQSSVKRNQKDNHTVFVLLIYRSIYFLQN